MNAGSELPRRRRRRSRLLLSGVLLTGLLLAAEVVVRSLGLVDVQGAVPTPEQAAFYAGGMLEHAPGPLLSYRNTPGAELIAGGVTYRHDGLGRRTGDAGPTPDDERPAVVFLGDSTTYGWGVPFEQTLPELTVAALGGRVRALNLGVSGYTTAQEVAAYEAARPHLGDAPLVVLVFYPNDAVDRGFEWDGRGGALYVDPLPLPRGVRRALWRSGLYQALVSWRAGRLAETGALDADPEHMDHVRDQLRRLAERVAEDGRRLVVAHLPGMVELDPYLYGWAPDELAGACARLDVPFVDLLPPFLAERERLVAEYETATGQAVEPLAHRNFLSRYWLVPGKDHHLTGEANRIAARALAAALAPLLP